ncbi:MAG: hypothetical protein ACFHVJ_05585 [Aestuariibacter sp.]
MKLLFSTLLCLCLSACASRSGHSDIVQQQFLTDIKENDSKIFVYIANFKVARPKSQEQIINEMAGNNSAKQHVRQKQRQSADRQLEEKLTDALEDKILNTGYCRNGYFVLSQYIDFGSGEIRGECRESATDVDRALFGN